MSDITTTIIAKRYRLEKRLGSGAMGDVWLAEDLRLKRRVAVKVLDARWAEADDALQRFELEATAAAKLHSPHIVQIHDYGIEDDNPYIVMEHIRGEDLRSRLKRLRRLGVEETADIILQVCKALRVAHDHGIVHRDLKPANLMFDISEDGEETLKVLDFGVAKSTVDRQATTTKAGALLGTPQYMAPEQARGMPDVDHRADLWSVGVLAYRMLTGKLPFIGQTVPDTIIKICTTKPPPPSKWRPDLPPEVDEWFLTALAIEREDRFQSSRELTEAYFIMTQLSTPSLSIPGSAMWGTMSARGMPMSRPRILSDPDSDRVSGMIEDSVNSFASAPSYPQPGSSVGSDSPPTLPTSVGSPDSSYNGPISGRGSQPSASLGSASVMIGDEGVSRVKPRNARILVGAVLGLAGAFIGGVAAISDRPEPVADTPALTQTVEPGTATQGEEAADIGAAPGGVVPTAEPSAEPAAEPGDVAPTAEPSAEPAASSAKPVAEKAPPRPAFRPRAKTPKPADDQGLFDDRY